jgi:hypothetical protein
MVQVTVKMNYGYMVYGNMKPEWISKMSELGPEMDSLKEHAKSHGFHMKYWGHHFGVSENIIVVFKSEKDLGGLMKMNQATTLPYDGARTILAARD